MRSFILSFYKAAGVRHEEFIGIDNFRFILTDRIFWGALANTVLFSVLFLIVWIPASLGLAATYSFYAVSALVSLFFVRAMVHETRGKELEDMVG